jgi:hypothetical protein
LFSDSFLLAFCGFLRVGEVSCKSGGPDHTIQFHDFKILQESIEFHIAFSKNVLEAFLQKGACVYPDLT